MSFPRTETCYQCILNYYPDYDTVQRQKKLREVLVIFGRRKKNEAHIAAEPYLQLYRNARKTFENLQEDVTIDLNKVCGIQTWTFTKHHVGIMAKLKRAEAKAQMMALVLKDRTYVFQQMVRDNESALQPLEGFERKLKEKLGILHKWNCTIHMSERASEDPDEVELHLTQTSLSMVDIKKRQCLKLWNLGEIKSCHTPTEDKNTVQVLFNTSIELNLKLSSPCKDVQAFINHTCCIYKRSIGYIKNNSCSLTRNYCIKKNKSVQHHGDQLVVNPDECDPVVKSHRSASCPNISSRDWQQRFKNRPSVKLQNSTNSGGRKNPGIGEVSWHTIDLDDGESGLSQSATRPRSRSVTSFGDRKSLMGTEICRPSSQGDISDIQNMQEDLMHSSDDERPETWVNRRRSTKKVYKKTITTCGHRESIRLKADLDTSRSEYRQTDQEESKRPSRLTSKFIGTEVVFTLQRILEKRPVSKDTLKLPWNVYIKMCFSLFPTYGTSKDWRDLADRLGFTCEDIQMINMFYAQTPIVPLPDVLIQCWQDRYNRYNGRNCPPCTKATLMQFLEEMERLDILDILKE